MKLMYGSVCLLALAGLLTGCGERAGDGAPLLSDEGLGASGTALTTTRLEAERATLTGCWSEAGGDSPSSNVVSKVVGFEAGDRICWNDVSLTGVTGVTAHVGAPYASGSAQLQFNGTNLATLALGSATGGWSSPTLANISAKVSGSGVGTLCLVGVSSCCGWIYSVDYLELTASDVCTPTCNGIQCGGSNGCGGTCGCSPGNECKAGTCEPVCIPDCTGKECGSDGCGGTCAPGCSAGESCDASGQCVGSSVCASDPLLVSAATASSIEAGSAQYAAGMAVDGNSATRWSSSFSDPQWIQLDLGAVRYIDRVVLDWEVAASARYELQTSTDGSTWSTVHTVASGNGGVDDIDGLDVRGRYLRMLSTARTTEWGNSLWELRVYGDLDPDCGCKPVCDGVRCGIGDGCGGTCGCNAGDTCNAGTCEICTPVCDGISCNVSDGCGGTCGCSAGDTCVAGRCSESDVVGDLLRTMTLRQKIAQMAQGSLDAVSPDRAAELGLGSVIKGVPGDASPSSWADKMDWLQDAAQRRSAHRIPMLYGVDAVHGDGDVKGATIFPHNIGLGATRNAALVGRIAAITAIEMRAVGHHWTFGPALSVVRDQRWGRTYESFGEHPSIVTPLGTAMMGLQGTTLGPDSVLVTVKHFAGDGGAVWGTGMNGLIDRGNAQMNEAALRAIHLSPYLPAIAAGAGSAMASFSSWNGEAMHGSQRMLTQMLKGEFGLNGFVVSDWNGIIDQLPGPFANQVRVGVNAGLDVLMLPGDFENFIGVLEAEVLAGRVSAARVEDAAARILRKKLALGLFDDPWARREHLNLVGSAQHRDVARQAVRESLVLLENKGILPLSRTDRVCVTGSGANSMQPMVGGWTLGWQAPAADPGGTTIRKAVEQLVGPANVVESGCDVGIRVVSEAPASYAEFLGDRADPSHDGSGSCTATRGCVVVILGGRPVNVEGLLADSQTKALVMAWQPGTEGLGVAEVLYGSYNFSGKLPVTWKRDAVNTPVNYCDNLAADANGNGIADECEDVGEHYSNKSLAAKPATVLYPIEYGLSY